MTHAAAAADWRSPLLAACALAPAGAGSAVRTGWWADAGAVVASWDFAVHGGSFGIASAATFVSAVDEAVRRGAPLVTLVRSGGTRLTEGVAALVGMPRAVLALQRLAAAGLPHLSVADHPTTGGVWVTVTARADVRLGVAGATVGFAGPRVVAAVTGHPPGPDSHTADAAADAGLLDAVLPGDAVPAALAGLLRCLRGADPAAPSAPTSAPVDLPAVAPAGRSAVQQIAATRAPGRPRAADVAAAALDALPAARSLAGTAEVGLQLGRIAGHPVVVVTLGRDRDRRPDAAGFAVLTRAAALADRLDLVLVTVVDTPGAEPGPVAERNGIAPAIGDAMAAVLTCRAPTLGLLVGEGGSGGALAALACDRVWVDPDAYFAALVPEGAAAALHRSVDEAADALALRPDDVVGLPQIDGLADLSGAAQHWAAAAVTDLRGQPTADRLAARQRRWG